MKFATWCLSPNFGDAVMPYLFEKITGRRPIYAQPGLDMDHVLLGGSILNWANEHSVVWGAGLASWMDQVPKAKEIRIVRGPLARMRAQSCEVECPEAYGDPALLLPKFYQSIMARKYPVAIFPHYVDLPRAHEMFGERVKIIDPLQPVEKVIDDIVSCGKIYSSALHGLIVADAYGIDNEWVKLGDSIGGDGMKYADYFISVRRSDMKYLPMPLDWREGQKVVDLEAPCAHADFEGVIQPLQNKLLETFPK